MVDRGFIWNAVNTRNLKIDVRQENGYSPLNMKNNFCVTNDVMFAYVHTKRDILLSVLSIFFFFFMILIWIHKVFHT